MIKGPSRAIAAWLKNANPEETVSIEVMEYALRILINISLIIIISLGIGHSTGKYGETALALFTFILLRFFSGGIHLRSSLGCITTTVVLCSIIPHLPVLSKSEMLIFTFICILLLLLFAPQVDSEAGFKPKVKPLFKIISICIVSSNLILCSSIIAVTFLIQCLTLIPLKGDK
ncbi:accessory gene regulator B family protein [Paenibacillus sp. MZ04-78.2]|uniref:accessory gene regulator B family protein n=1 Tax=Paenibacillus sp. MZ04-78.2 TaxID=2962034 RepID=UPI0020B728C4|nr:accessory gene regulator B family protein [Paenibacillus sp. MZ04-78.2]MCP3774749.1 accessory gene regulator B family protein [Paenibacillus sp. MZ04-78.2]